MNQHSNPFATAFRAANASDHQDAIRQHMRAARNAELSVNELWDIGQPPKPTALLDWQAVRASIERFGPSTSVQIADRLGVSPQRVQSVMAYRRAVPIFVKLGFERAVRINGRGYSIQIWGLA